MFNKKPAALLFVFCLLIPSLHKKSLGVFQLFCEIYIYTQSHKSRIFKQIWKLIHQVYFCLSSVLVCACVCMCVWIPIMHNIHTYTYNTNMYAIELSLCVHPSFCNTHTHIFPIYPFLYIMSRLLINSLTNFFPFNFYSLIY